VGVDQEDEARRLAALRRTAVLDTAPEQVFDDITALASAICGTPISLITLIDEQRQWFKSRVGLEVTETPRDIAFCHHTIQHTDVMIVPDARADPRFADNPLVTGDLGIQFYAGAPLITDDDQRIGTVCVIDQVPRRLDPSQVSQLETLARHASSLLTLRANQQELAQHRALLQSILDNTPTTITVKDLAGRYVLANDAMAVLHGVGPDEIIGKTDRELLRDDDLAAARAELARRALDEGPVTVRSANPKGRESLLVTFPLQGDDGRPFGTGDIAADMSGQLDAEHEAAELQRRFEQARRLEGLGHLAGGVAHDFNNLLAVIMASTGFAEDALDADALTMDLAQVRADIAEIRGAAERAARLTRQLLVFAQRETGEPVLLDLNALVHEFGQMLRRTLGAATQVVLDLSEQPCWVQADRSQLEQVLLNLSLNARDAMPDGGTLTISTARESGSSNPPPLGSAPTAAVVLSVRDEGVGMDDDVAARAFEPFFSTKGSTGGSGLGLATVHGAVAKAGGAVQIDTSPGAGTALVVHLPAVAASAAPATVVDPDVGVDTRGARILLVEDQDVVRRITARMLEREGHAVLAARDADDALRAWRGAGGAVDLLVTDVVLGGRSGVTLAEELRIERPGLPVLLISGYPDTGGDGDEERLPLLQKPFTQAALLEAIEAALGEVGP
jgi:PAS domain S-box-containing protein